MLKKLFITIKKLTFLIKLPLLLFYDPFYENTSPTKVVKGNKS
jgi:hypothetical protein